MARDQYQPHTQDERDERNERREEVRESLESDAYDTIRREILSAGAQPTGLLCAYSSIDTLYAALDQLIVDALNEPICEGRPARIGTAFAVMIEEAIEREAKARVSERDIYGAIERQDSDEAFARFEAQR